jgi:hypothetical protein
LLAAIGPAQQRGSLGVMFNLPITIVYFAILSATQALILSRSNKSGARIKSPRPVLVSQISSVVDQLKANHKGSWSYAVFTFCPPGERHSNKTEVQLRFSVENGKVGLDWSRFTRRNIADKDKIVAFIQEQHQTVLQGGNRVRYFRVEDGDVSQLGVEILEEFYHLPSNGEIGMFAYGFGTG